jgi:hypothetical protein
MLFGRKYVKLFCAILSCTTVCVVYDPLQFTVRLSSDVASKENLKLLQQNFPTFMLL